MENNIIHSANEGDVDLLGCKYVGEGHNGKIYLLKDGRILKLFKNRKACSEEYEILSSVDGNPHFPHVYEYGINYMIRDYVGGENLKKFIEQNGLPEYLAHNIINLMEEFKRLNFTKIDIRCKDIFVQEDGSLKVIDPKSLYRRERDYPHKLMKGLNNLNVLDTFEKILKKIRPDLYKLWIIEGKNLEPEYYYGE